jgi:curved DNA-binding protein CbpA
VLQVHHDAEQGVIDAAYRCLSKLFHPDLNPDPKAAERMKEINAAYEAIGDAAARKAYHRRWMGKNAWKTLSEWGGTGWRVTESKEAYSAFEMLDAFFRDVLSERWEDAYGRLTEADKARVSLADFLEWRAAVRAVYLLGNYHISYFRRYDDCRYEGETYPRAYHFIARVTELQQLSGRITESSSHKYVALDGGVLRVCLGAKDLGKAAAEYRRLAAMAADGGAKEPLLRAAARLDPGTGALAREAWLEEAERERRRTLRYGGAFCMGAITFAPGLRGDGELQGDDSLEMNMAYAARFVSERVRDTDVLGRGSDLALVLLLPETKPGRGKKAMEKVVSLLRDDPHISENFPCEVSAAIMPCGEDVGEDLEALLKQLGIERAERPGMG